MLFLKIIAHSFNMLMHKPAVTLRIYAVPMILSYITLLVGGYVTFGQPASLLIDQEIEVTNSFDLSTFFLVTLTIVIAAFYGVWAAVGWHRYALLGEEPGPFFPSFFLGRIAAYIGTSILLGFCIVVGFVFLAFISQPLAWLGVAGALIGAALICTLGVGICTILPGTAIQSPVTIPVAFDKIFSELPTIVFIGCSLAIIAVAPPYLAGLSGNLTVMAVVGVLTDLVFAILSLSILTTLYGTWYQGRNLG